MALKVYRARSMNDALAELKRDLGQDAVILHTRNYKAGGLFGIGARTVVEITASTDDNPPTRRPLPTPKHRLPSARAADLPARGEPQPASAAASDAASDTDPGPRPGSSPLATSRIPAADRLADAYPDPLAGLALQPASHREPAPRGPRPEPRPEPRVMQVASSRANQSPPDDIQAIKRMVSRLLQTSAASNAGAMSDPLFDHYLRLQENAVASEIADDIVGSVRDELSAAELADPEIVRETLLRRIAALVPTTEAIAARKRPADGRPRTLALIGPTGVGKTTTLAKLAATAKLRQGRRVGLITTDTYRIAAVEQLRTYADIIGLPLTVVASPAEMQPALESMADLDEILIDTAGRSQHDATRLTELRAYLDEADPHEIHLVLSSVASQAVLERAVDNFAPLTPNRLIITKLDEAVNFGVLLSVVQRLGVALSYVTTGQEVPDHIEQGTPERIARMILTGSVPE